MVLNLITQRKRVVHKTDLIMTDYAEVKAWVASQYSGHRGVAWKVDDGYTLIVVLYDAWIWQRDESLPVYDYPVLALS